MRQTHILEIVGSNPTPVIFRSVALIGRAEVSKTSGPYKVNLGSNPSRPVSHTQVRRWMKKYYPEIKFYERKL